MKEFDYKVKESLGLHARPAQQLSNYAKECGCSVKISNEEGQTDLRDVINMMLLNITQDQLIRFEIDGENEDVVMKELKSLVEEIL